MAARTKVFVDITTTSDGQKPGTGLVKFAAAAGIATGALLLLTRGAKEWAKAASDAEEIGSKFNTIFRDMSREANNVADSFADSFNLANSTSRELLGNTADLLTGLGFTQAGALDLSKQVNTLAADLASFSNFAGGTTGASEALTKALLGEAESAKALGIVINQNTKEYKDAIKFYTEVEGKTLLQAKAYTALQFATEQSGNAIGDVSRTMESAANVTRRLEEASKSYKEELGAVVNEGLTPLKSRLADINELNAEYLRQLRELKEANENVAAGVATFDDRLSILNDELQSHKELLKIIQDSRAFADAATMEAIDEQIKGQQGLIDLTERKIGSIMREQGAISSRERVRQEVAAEEAQANADAKAREEELAIAFEKTKEGKIAALEASIALFETYKSGPESIAVLADLNEQLEKMTGITKELGETIVTAWEGPLENVNKTFLETIDSMAWVEGLFKEVTEEIENQHTAVVAAGEDWLSIEQAKIDHLIWIDNLETEINERRLKESEAEMAANEKLMKAKIDLAFKYANASMSLLTAIGDLSSTEDAAELQRLDDNLRAKLEAAEADGATDEELTALKESNADALDAKKRQIAHDEAVRKKKLGRFQVLVDTAAGIAEAIPNLVLMGIAAAAGVVQLAAVEAAPIPALATGGKFTTQGATTFTAGEQGQEEVTVRPTSGGGNNNNDIFRLLSPGGDFLGWIQREGIDNRGLVSHTGAQL